MSIMGDKTRRNLSLPPPPSFSYTLDMHAYLVAAMCVVQYVCCAVKLYVLLRLEGRESDAHRHDAMMS